LQWSDFAATKSYEVEDVNFRRFLFNSKCAQSGTGPRNICGQVAGGSDKT